MYCQFEHASGYVLVHVEQTDDINQIDVNDWASFSQSCRLVAFKPFTSAANALDNMNNISEGLVHDDMKAFLSSNLPSGQTVGILDSKLLQAVKEDLGCKVAGGEIVQEICRGVRVHLSKFIKALGPEKENMAQLGLGHSYSRSKVKFNVNRSDNMVIQAIALIDQLDKDINTFSMRVREWYGYHFPELVRLVNDNYQYCQLVG
jgi:nucleolar protein 56